MAYTGFVADRPATLPGCLQTFSETTDKSAVWRTTMESGQTIKVRPLVTAPIRTASVTVTLPAELLSAMKDWHESRCRFGAYPTRFMMPWMEEQIWRFSSPIQYEYIRGKTRGIGAVKCTFTIEQLPNWK